MFFLSISPQTLMRDGYRCVVTGFFDMESCQDPRAKAIYAENKRTGPVVTTECALIICDLSNLNLDLEEPRQQVGPL